MSIAVRKVASLVVYLIQKLIDPVVATLCIVAEFVAATYCEDEAVKRPELPNSPAAPPVGPVEFGQARPWFPLPDESRTVLVAQSFAQAPSSIFQYPTSPLFNPAVG